MRELIEHVRFAPLGGKRKVYVLDEAHMLTGPAWNALLKTLEEPPAYAFFIFATTEWHKIPATIVSRCQRFEFGRIPDDLLTARVKEVAKEEEMKIDDDVVALIVSRADGCVRDAETLLGQLTSVGGKKLTLDIASLVIPRGYGDLAKNVIALWAKRDHAAALAEAKRLSDDGVPLVPFFDDLIEEVRRLLIDSADASKPQLFSPGELNDLALLLFERRKDAKSGIDPLFALQLAGTIAANGLLRHASSATAPPPMPAPASVSVPKAEPKTKANLESETKPQPPVEPPLKAQVPVQVTPPAPVQASAAAPTTPAAPSKLELNFVRMKWPAVVRKVEETNHSLPFILKIARPESLNGNAVVLRFQYPFHYDKIIAEPKNRHIVELALREVLGDGDVTLEGVVGEDPGKAEERSQDIVSNILKAFGGSVVES
jgi:DNA polymerase-3 subunit gamma/tau